MKFLVIVGRGVEGETWQVYVRARELVCVRARA